jgi:hypothetical protein
VVTRCAAVLALILAGAAPAAAEPSLVERAEAALDDLRYEEAAELVDRAWRSGGNDRDQLQAIFRLAGQIQVTLGKGEVAERHFERLLALDPQATLPDGISPKIAARFAAARARVESRGPLRARLRAEGMVVSAEVTSDPADMVAGLRARYAVGGKDKVIEVLEPEPLVIELTVGGATEVELLLMDSHGNVLAEERVTVAPEEEPTDTVGPVEDRTDRAATMAVRNASRFRETTQPMPSAPLARWAVWAGAAAGLGVVGIAFGLKSRSDQNELDELNGDSGDHDFREAEAIEERLRRDTLVANVSFVLAAGAGTAALVLWMRERRGRRNVQVAPTAKGTGAALRFEF